MIGVDGAAGTDDVAPPIAHRVCGTGERVEDDDEIVARLVQRSIEKIRLLDVTQHLTAFQLEPVEELRAAVTLRPSRPRL
jgi:hypothetical protein